MDCEVIVVGAGIGGLVTAGLLAARGVDVCLLERQSRVGGCVASSSHLGYDFEPTVGLYSGWAADGTWERIFSELPLPRPAVTKLSPNFVVRLANRSDVEVSDDRGRFEQNLAKAFPSCADAAITFFHELDQFESATNAGTLELSSLLANASPDFRDFIDVQLQTFAQCTSNDCSVLRAAEVLAVARGGLWSIDGGAQVLAERLADSVRASGGRVRLDAPVLRLAYKSDGTPIGVDLLSGERVTARRAIISNLTIWDTYGKLVGLTRTPREVAARLKSISAWGAYLLFLTIDDPNRLPASHALVVCDRTETGPYAPERNQLAINLTAKTSTASGNTAMTVTTFTHAQDWFSFHEDSTSHEQQDQAALELWWKRLHQALPELGSSVELIETATPQTFYETTRRRFGMIGRPVSGSGNSFEFSRTGLPNLFLVGDTSSQGIGLQGVAQSALALANLLANQSN